MTTLLGVFVRLLDGNISRGGCGCHFSGHRGGGCIKRFRFFNLSWVANSSPKYFIVTEPTEGARVHFSIIIWRMTDNFACQKFSDIDEQAAINFKT